MKTRRDFVSNSSSCSFFVSLASEDDVAEFRKLLGALKEQRVYMEFFGNLAAANDRWDGLPFDGEGGSLEWLAPGCLVLCDSGEDHDSWYEARYRAMEDLFLESGHKFRLYADKEAHMTVMDDLPEAGEP